ncbi:MAG: hypothetical protein RL748_2133 [Pseudomonadota bacterium]
MSKRKAEILKREKSALAAIRAAFGTADDEFGATMFVSHHLEEIEADYWKTHLGTEKPEPIRVLDILVLLSHLSDEDEDGIDVFDFTLPDDITNYVLSVHFDDNGEVDDISMES